ncbi:MAG: helix-turn-helix domain-containing protein [Prevotella sp.]
MMRTHNFIDFGQHSESCHTISDSFVLWHITGRDESLPILLTGCGTDMIVHILMLEGEMRVGCGGRHYLLTKGCFANFLDIKSLEACDVSADAEAYVMLLAAPYIISLLKHTPPFPPTYVLKIKQCPVSVMPAETVLLFKRRIESMVYILLDRDHHFQSDMLGCALRMLMMDMANEHIRQEETGGDLATTGRKQVIFKQFIRLLLTHIRDEHNVRWYASQLCVTPQYLNRVVKQTSQKTAYDHICTTLTGAIIEQLENTDRSVLQIADTFHFPDQATLSKFFKRQTGKTPTEYRRENTKA